MAELVQPERLDIPGDVELDDGVGGGEHPAAHGPRGNRLTPYLLGGVGGAIHGNEWGARAGGIAFSFGVGAEYQISERLVVTMLPAYQPVLFRRFTDATLQERAAGPLGFGLAHWLAVQVVIEVRDPLARW